MKTSPTTNTLQKTAGTSSSLSLRKSKNTANNLNKSHPFSCRVLRNIAKQLPVRDYNGLRLLCSDFADKLVHIRGMVNGYYNHNGCPEDMKHDRDKLLFSAIMEKVSEHTLSGLKGWKIKNSPRPPMTSSSGLLIVSPSVLPSPILPPSFPECAWSVCLSFPRDKDGKPPEMYMANQLLHKMDPELIIASNVINTRPPIMSVEISFSLNLQEYALTEAFVSQLFSKAGALFHKDSVDGGLALAVLMSSIYQYFTTIKLDNGQRQFSDELLSQYRRNYNDMFVAGDIINQFYPPEIGD